MQGLLGLYIGIILVLAAFFIWGRLGYSFTPSYGRGQNRNEGLKHMMSTDPQQEVIAVAGTPQDEIWDDSNWLEWIKGVHRQGANVKIVFGAEGDTKSEENIREMVRDKIIEVHRISESETRHFVIGDGRVAHIEEEHPPTVRNPKGIFVESLFKRSYMRHEQKFNELWRMGKPQLITTM